jgi:YVTN family beta-propeller protein
LALHPDGTRLVVSNPWDSSLSVIDTDTFEVVGTIPLIGLPSAMAFHPSGSVLYVTCRQRVRDWTLEVVDVERGETIDSIVLARDRVWPTAIAVSAAGDRAYIVNSPSLSVTSVDTASHQVVATGFVSAGLGGIAVDPNGSRVYVPCNRFTALMELDADRLSIEGSAFVGPYPRGAGAFLQASYPKPCLEGDVNAGAGYPTTALTVNGTRGDDGRVVRVAHGSPIELSLRAAPAGPDPAAYVVWIWRGVPARPTDLLTPTGQRLGCLANPTPLQPELEPQPVGCLGGGAAPASCAGGRHFPLSPRRAPWTIRRNRGWSTAGTYTLQGVIADDGARSSARVSVTNAVIVQID